MRLREIGKFTKVNSDLGAITAGKGEIYFG